MRRTRGAPRFDRDAGAACLAAGINQLGLSVNERDQARLLDYIGELAAWNATHNLTAVRDPADMIVRHLLDCLAIADHIDGARVADVGTGPGLPGLVLAVLAPDTEFVLIESSYKKAAFLRHARRALGLDNVEVMATRVEAAQVSAPLDWIVTRAFASAAQTVHHAGPLIGPDTRVGLMKARAFEAEAADLPAGYRQIADHALCVPGLDEIRRLVVIARD